MCITFEWTFWTFLLGLLVLIGISYVFWGNYKRYKSYFTRGLLFFAFLILINRIVLIILLLPFISHIIPTVLLNFINNNYTDISFLGGLIQLVGFIILLRIIME